MARINAACKKLARLCCKSSAATSLALSLVVSSAIAQPTAEALERSRQELGVFSDLLSVGLGLDEPGGLFGMNVGSIQSRYLFGQGAYLGGNAQTPIGNVTHDLLNCILFLFLYLLCNFHCCFW